MERAVLLWGVIGEWRVGPRRRSSAWRARLFANSENLTNVRQTRRDPLVRPSRAADGRWIVDVWGPLEGRIFNAGVRFGF